MLLAVQRRTPDPQSRGPASTRLASWPITGMARLEHDIACLIGCGADAGCIPAGPGMGSTSVGRSDDLRAIPRESAFRQTLVHGLKLSCHARICVASSYNAAQLFDMIAGQEVMDEFFPDMTCSAERVVGRFAHDISPSITRPGTPPIRPSSRSTALSATGVAKSAMPTTLRFCAADAQGPGGDAARRRTLYETAGAAHPTAEFIEASWRS